MKIGDKVKVGVPWKFGFQPVEKEGTIEEIYSNGFCKVKIPLEHGGYRVVKGHLSNYVLIE